ncbi:MAG: hypothetical protein FJY20_00440 [Bacteroidetes bacterium]|nr:hypothetical protein [Bacteroidota bacterium]
MLRISLCLLLCFPINAFSQKHLDKTKEEVKKELGKYVAANSQLRPALTETDSTLVLSVTEQSQPASFVYGFDRTTGKCNYQQTKASCDSCYKKYLKTLLDQNVYRWKKINENQYVSAFEYQLLLELPAEANEYSFILFKTQWTKELYDLLIKD